MKSAMILLLTKSNTMNLAGHVARHGEKRNAHSVLFGKLEKKKYTLEDIGLGRRIILK